LRSSLGFEAQARQPDRPITPVAITYTTSEALQAGAALGDCLFRFVILMMLLIIFSLVLSLVGAFLFWAFGSHDL